MKKPEKEIRILQLKELNSSVYQKKMQRSIEQAHMEEDSEERAEAQDTLWNLIMNLGGIREDVFEYLLVPHFTNAKAVVSIGRLLCYAAPVEWIALAVQALERTMGDMYVNEITESYQAGLSIEQVESFLKESDTVFEMCQCRIHFMEEELRDKLTGGRKEELRDKLTASKEIKAGNSVDGKSKLEDNVTGSEEVEVENWVEANKNPIAGNDISYSAFAQIVAEAVVNAMQKSRQMIDTESKAEPRDSVTGSEEARLEDNMNGSKKGDLSEAEKFFGGAEAYKPEELPDFPDGEELQDNRILVKELTEAEEQAGKRISFFQILLSRHMKKAFAKLDTEAQVSKIFEIMVEKKYGKEKILPIRRLMNGGMSNEFIFSLLEKDFSGEELNELCETLLAEDMGVSGGQMRVSHNRPEYESGEEWEEEV